MKTDKKYILPEMMSNDFIHCHTVHQLIITVILLIFRRWVFKDFKRETNVVQKCSTKCDLDACAFHYFKLLINQ